jgi:hypothetical protein
MLRYNSRQNPSDRINLATRYTYLGEFQFFMCFQSSTLRLLKRIQEFNSLEKSLERHKEASHKARFEYEIRMRSILNSLRDIDVKRASSLRDAIGKYMVYQTSALRNMQYDMDVTIQVNKTTAIEFVLKICDARVPTMFVCFSYENLILSQC